jgi:hypothetical protein
MRWMYEVVVFLCLFSYCLALLRSFNAQVSSFFHACMLNILPPEDDSML